MSRFTASMMALATAGMAAVGCGGGDPAATPSLEPPPAGEGVQIVMTSTIEAHFETERCMFYQVPAEGLYVNREQACRAVSQARLPEGALQLVERGFAGTELFVGHARQRHVGGAVDVVHVGGALFDEQQSGGDLAPVAELFQLL